MPVRILLLLTVRKASERTSRNLIEGWNALANVKILW
jgi:hypothetical protein